jgi:hypothetical protein
LSQVTAADFKYPNEDGEVSDSEDEPEDPSHADYTKDMPTNLGDTLDQEHEVTYVLGLTGMANYVTDREQEKLEQEKNDGEIHEDVNTQGTAGSNLTHLPRGR